MNRNEEFLEAVKKPDANIEDIKALLDDIDNIVELDYRDDYGITPLSWACFRGNATVTEFLLSRNADIGSRDRAGDTPLSVACSNGHADVVALLLDHGAYINSRNDNGITSLSWACMSDHANVVTLLLERGADIELKDNEGKSVLDHAANNPEIKCLIEEEQERRLISLQI